MEAASLPQQVASLGAAARQVAERARGDVLASASHFHQRTLPSGRLRLLVHGLLLPYHLLRPLWRDAAARRLYLRVGLAQSLMVLVLGLGMVGEELLARSARVERVELPVAPGAPSAPGTTYKLKVGGRSFSFTVDRDGRDEGDEGDEGDKGDKDAAPSPPPVSEEGQEADAKADAAEDAPEGSQEDAQEESEPPSLSLFWLKLLAALQGAQWIVIALSRDYHEAIGREASLRSGLEPEEPPLTPRVRLNVPWLMSRLRRRIHFAWLIGLATPVLLLVRFSLPAPVNDWAFSALGLAWSAWWLMVATASKSARAWEDTSAPAPWYLRGWHWLAERAPLLNHFPLSAYASLCASSARRFFSPAACAERQPWALFGLAVVNALSELPFLKCFVRPLIPVSAAHLLVAGHAPAPLPDAAPAPALPPTGS